MTLNRHIHNASTAIRICAFPGTSYASQHKRGDAELRIVFGRGTYTVRQRATKCGMV